MQIRIQSAALLLAAALAVAAPPASQPATTQPSPQAARVPHTRPPEGKTMELLLHELGNFEYAEGNDDTIPADVRQLDGVRVRLPGQMLPIDSAARVSQFLLVNDMMSCCYGSAPKVQTVALCKLPEGKWLSATGERIMVEGILHVKVKREEGYVTSIFQVDAQSIKMAPQ
jgi:hypothetical protein